MSKVSAVASNVVKLPPVPEMEYGWKLHRIKLVRNPSVSVSEFGVLIFESQNFLGQNKGPDSNAASYPARTAEIPSKTAARPTKGAIEYQHIVAAKSME